MRIAETTDKVANLLFEASARLEPEYGSDASIEARAILAGVLGCGTTDLFLRSREEVGPLFRDRFFELVERRLKREPVAYLLGSMPFFGIEFVATPDVLIPRPETELLVECALEILSRIPVNPKRVLEIGTGSGCIAVALALRSSSASILATDVSSPALNVARENARRVGVADKIQFTQSNLYTEISSGKTGHFDMIVSNPPYVRTREMRGLDPDLGYEPRVALEAGEQGLDVICPLVSGAPRFLKPGGILALEFGIDQSNLISELMVANRFDKLMIHKDFRGLDRVIQGEYRGSI